MQLTWVLLCTLVVGLRALETEELIQHQCPAGRTGSQCESPLCNTTNTQINVHDPQANYGDMVAVFQAKSCDGEQFNFYVDNFLPDFWLSVSTTAKDSFPQYTVRDPNGNQIPLCTVNFISQQQRVAEFCHISLDYPAGQWSVQLKMQTEGDCLVQVSSKTPLSIDGGFVTDLAADDAQTFIPLDNQAIGRYPQQGVPSYLAFRMQNDVFPVHPVSVHIYADGVWDQELSLLTRYRCGFPHITDTAFNCSALVDYHVQFIGIDNNGNTFTRVYEFTCDAGQQPSTTPGPTNPPVDICYNGGILQSGVCYCGEKWEGDQCEFMVCLNGGEQTFHGANQYCLCETGFTGDHCEHVQCKVRSDDVFEEVYRALGFVVRSSQSMLAQRDQIVAAAKNLTSYYNTVHPNYFKTYVLSVVTNGAVTLTREYEKASQFISAIQALTNPPVDTVCNDALLAAVGEVIDTPSFKMYPNSPIFVFSDGVVNDQISTIGYVMQQLSYVRAQVFFLLSDSSNGQCNVDITSEGYQTLLGFASYTQGLAVKTDLSRLAETTVEIGKTLFLSSIMSGNDLLDCRKAPAYQPFFVDETTDVIYLSATGINLTLTLTGPDLDTITPESYYSAGNLYIWSMNNPPIGAYMVTLKSAITGQVECSYRVYSQNRYTLYFGTSTDMTTDVYTKQPVVGHESHLVARVDNLYLSDPLDVSTEITLWTNDLNSGRVILYSSSGMWRDGCNYELYFGSFSCKTPGLGFFATVYVTDNTGITMQRTTTGYCAAAIPNPPDNQCQNGGAMFNGTCVCLPHFYGSKCEKISCQNQGTPLFGACQCPPGYSGTFCEIVACTSFQEILITFDYRSLTFLMHDSITTRSVFRSINDMAPRVVHDIVQQHPKWIYNYEAIRFNDTDNEVIVNSGNPQDFLTGLNSMYLYNQQHSDYSCNTLDLYATILAALENEKVSYGGIFYVFVYGVARPDLPSFDKIMNHVELNKIQINVVQFSLNPCGQDYTQDGLIGLTQATGGQYFVSSGPNAGNVISSIPSTHGSGLVYQRSVPSCKNSTFYVPIDYGTQSFSVYIEGELTADPVYKTPDGSPINFYLYSNVWNDIGSDSRFDQIIPACDDFFTLNNGHCWQFGSIPMDWYSARDYCYSLGASLATVYNKADQANLDKNTPGSTFWIGLNNIVDLNNFVWDIGVNQSVPLSTIGYTHWATKQPNLDPTKRCVLDDNDGPDGWETADCSQKAAYACVKGTYNAAFTPNDDDPTMIPAGLWSVGLQADGACSITIRSQSNLQIITEYTTDVHSDTGMPEPIAASKENRVIAHVTGLASGTTQSLEYAHFYGNNGTILAANTMAYRSGCMFNYLSSAFGCPDSSFQMQLTGVDSAGYLYQRIVPVTCLAGPTPNSCENGAVYYDGFCICSPNFFGEHCEVALCQNGGFPGADLSKCICRQGFVGEFCEIPMCLRGGDRLPDDNVNKRTFVVVLDGSNSGLMGDVLKYISGTLSNVVNSALQSHAQWFTNYVAVVVRDSKSAPAVNPISSIIKDTDYQKWSAAIQAEIDAHPYTSTITKRGLFSGLAAVLSDPSVNPLSIGFVITSSSAEDTNSEIMVQNVISNTHTMINMLFIGDQTAPGGGNDYNDPSVADLFTTAHLSGGGAYQIPAAAGLQLTWIQLLGTLYNSATVMTHHIDNCAQFTDYLQLGLNGSEIIIDLFAKGDISTLLVDPDGNNDNTQPLISSATNEIRTFTLDGGAGHAESSGIWTVNLAAPVGEVTGKCMFSARTISSVKVYVGFTQDVEMDGGVHDGNADMYPQANNEMNAVVASQIGGTVLTYVQLFDIEENALIWASPMVYRKQCAFPYISVGNFACDRPNFLLAIDGLDAVGHPFRRVYTYHCQGHITTKAPTPSLAPVSTTPMGPTQPALPTCDPSVPIVDLVIAFDSSSGMDLDTYQMVTAKFQNLIFNVEIDSNHTRMMLGTYDTVQHFDGTDMNTVNDTQSYAARMGQLQFVGYTGEYGNNIDDWQTYLLLTIHPSTPFRANARKVFVFISTMGWDKGNYFDNQDNGYSNPIPDADILRGLGVEYIPIAFGANANVTQLSQFSTKCLQVTPGVDDIVNAVNFIASNICQQTPQC